MTIVEAPAIDTTETPWVADLHSESADEGCQSSVSFDDHPCTGSPRWYAQIEVREYNVANPQWEGKLCDACLAGWKAWSVKEPDTIWIRSQTPIVRG